MIYLKINFLQQKAASSGVSQTKVSRLAGVLLDMLNQALARLALLPVRDDSQLVHRLAAHPDRVLTYGGVERGIPRNPDPNGQEKGYSTEKR